ncbi:MAG: chemotaxis protein, partial [Lautropia sp.]|nr:chemotaxis protein [Lautropia sp.]
MATHLPSFPVVGIGASAGGLSALLGLLDHLPPDCGFALVVVLHLPAKDAESALPILERGTSMPVLKLTASAELQSNHLYLVPSRHETFADGLSLRASPATHPGSETSIDRFFRTLADAYQCRTVGVVLSGTGSDGAVGLSYIREQGGVTIAQAPEDADHAGMPRAAIASGAVDLTLPVNDIPGCLARLWENARRLQIPPGQAAGGAEGPSGATPLTLATSPSDEQALSEIVELLRSRTRHDISHYKRATVLRRLRRRLQVTGLPDLPAYRDYLRDHVGETAPLLQDLLISVTSFFRDPAAMASLEHNVLPRLLQGRRTDDPIRVWVVGCATGEEAYSVGILLHELLAGASQPAIQVFATDIDERAIAVARSGLYPGAIASDVTPSRLRTFFNPEEDSFRVGKSLRESILFASHDILHDAPFSRLDLVLCRNLLIYLDREAQSIILETLRTVLGPRGHLFLGTA